MNRTLVAGTVLTVAGVLGYLAGLGTDYPGRAFSIPAAVVGITLLAVSGGLAR